MAINRAPFNALVDDDGSGLTGSVWNKSAIQNVVLDPVDAAIAASRADTFIESNATGVQNAWAPGLNGNTTIIWYGASDLILNGMAGGVPGQRVTIRHVTGNNVIYVAYTSASASNPAMRFQTAATSSATPIGPLGSATFVYDGAQGLWSLVAHDQGGWITPAYSAAHYGASLGTWTVPAGSRNVHKWRLQGRTIQASYVLAGTTAAGTSGGGLLTLGNPGFGSFGLVGAGSGEARPVARLDINGTVWPAIAQIQAATYIGIFRQDLGSLDGTVSVFVDFSFEIN